MDLPEDFPKEMMEELLLRLPLKAVTKFKCVSYYWNNLISGDEFRRCYQSRHCNASPKGFIYNLISIDRETTLSTLVIEPAIFVRTSDINKEEFCLPDDLRGLGEVVGSSKGLLLFVHGFFFNPCPIICYVYDSLTRNHVQLPKILTEYAYTAIGFICSEFAQNTSKGIICSGCYLTFKVVVIVGYDTLEEKTTYEIETYSPETNKWNKSVMTTAAGFILYPSLVAIVIGDILYWKSYSSKMILAYYPENPTGRAKLIEFPISECWGKVTISGTQDGCLLFISISATLDIKVWGLTKEKYFGEDIIKRGRWNFLHKISSAEHEQSLIDFRRAEPTFIKCTGIRSQDPCIIALRMTDEFTFISYKLNDKKVETIIHRGDGTELYIWVHEYLDFEYPTWPCIY